MNRRIFALAWPALGALAADPLLSLVDTTFVGRLGTEPLAALGIDSALFAFAFAVFNFLAYATTPMVAQARGRGDLVESGRVVVRGLVLALGIGVTAGAVLAVAGRPLVVAMRAGPDVVDPAVAYLTVRALAVPALLVITLGHGAFRGFGDTRTPLLVALGANGLNAILDPLLIFGAGMGLTGAAWATVIAQTAGAASFLVLLRRRARTEGWVTHRPAMAELVPFLRVGSVLVVRTLLLVAALTAATAAAAEIGTEAVAAHQIVSQIWFLLAMIVDALAIAAQTLVAERVGRGDPAGARAIADRLFGWGLVTGVALGGLFALAGRYLGPMFGVEPTVADTIEGVVPVAAAMQPLAALVFVADGVFLAVLAVRLLVASTFAGFVAAVAVIGATLTFGWGLVGVWWAITAMVGARGVVLGLAYRSGLTPSSA